MRRQLRGSGDYRPRLSVCDGWPRGATTCELMAGLRRRGDYIGDGHRPSVLRWCLHHEIQSAATCSGPRRTARSGIRMPDGPSLCAQSEIRAAMGRRGARRADALVPAAPAQQSSATVATQQRIGFAPLINHTAAKLIKRKVPIDSPAVIEAIVVCARTLLPGRDDRGPIDRWHRCRDAFIVWLTSGKIAVRSIMPVDCRAG